MTADITPFDQLPSDLIEQVRAAARAAAEADGTAPLSEAFLLGLPREARHLVATDDGRTIGFNHDFVGYFPIDMLEGGQSSTEALLTINHEYVNPLFVGGNTKERTPEQIQAEMREVGVSVVRVKREGREWRIVPDPRNRRIDALRKSRRPEPQDLDWGPEAAPDQADVLAMEEASEDLTRAIAALPEKQKALIEAAYFHDLSHSEIADQTGLPLGTIKSRIRLALDRLRHAMN